MERIICVLLALYGVVMLMMCFLQYYTVFKNNEKHKNNVHFYVARDMNGKLHLYLSKPFRRGGEFFSNEEHGIVMPHILKNFGLNPDDFKDLKWEDEPLEVFINMED